MYPLHSHPASFKGLEQLRPAFVTAAGAVYRAAPQGGIRRCTALDLALVSVSAMVVWRLEAQRQKQEG